MAKRVFFSFHYQDVIDFRANVVRNHWLTKANREAAGFFDASVWETAKKTDKTAIKRLINSGLEGTSVTCVLIGSETYARPWVRYEILKSFRRGNQIVAVHINSIASKDDEVKPLGQNPLRYVGVTFSGNGENATLHEKVGGTWKLYSQIGNSATYRVKQVAAQFRGKGFNLGRWYREYDWIGDKGYENFGDWVN